MNLETLEKYNGRKNSKGKFYSNKTWSFILPLVAKDTSLIKYVSQYSIVALGIKDRDVPDLYNKNSVGVLINARESKIDFNHPSIIDNYYYGELVYGHLHMLIIELLPGFRQAYYKYKEGKYSEMFPKPELIYKNKSISVANGITAKCIDICKRDKKLKNILENHLGVEIGDGELASIPNPKEEIFNYG